jgi:hypothetical protein
VSQGTSSAQRSGEKRSYKTVASDKATETGSLGKAYVSRLIGSNKQLDYLNKDLMRSADTRAASYYSKNSNIQ